jgi:hypothetical protein
MHLPQRNGVASDAEHPRDFRLPDTLTRQFADFLFLFEA